MRLSTIGPFYSPLQLTVGLDPKARRYAQVLEALPECSGHLRAPNRDHRKYGMREFADLDRDDLDLRLFVWTPETQAGAPQMRFHIYANGVGVVETDMEIEDTFDADALEKLAQEESCAAIDAHAQALYELLEGIERRLPAEVIKRSMRGQGSASSQGPNVEPLSKKVAWISRAIRLSPQQLGDPRVKDLVRAWLKNTSDPQEADAILSGERYSAVSWMNYVLVDPPKEDAFNPLSAVRIAQFFYASQNQLNETVHRLLRDGEFERDTSVFKEALIHARSDMQTLRILFDMQLGLMSRQKRRMLDFLMETWDFSTLTHNGERILEACTQRIDEITSARAERGTFYTDMILAFIALVSIIEVTLYLTEYSREVVSRPTLAYQDDRLSWLLSWFASIDMDRGLLSGAAMFLVMAGLYVFWKKR